MLGLERDGIQRGRRQIKPFQARAYPVHQTQRGGIRIPTWLRALTVLQNPTQHPLLLQVAALRLYISRRHEVVEVVQVVKPQHARPLVAPILRILNAALNLQEACTAPFKQRLLAPWPWLPRCLHFTTSTMFRHSNSLARQAIAHLIHELNRPQVTQRVKIKR